MKQLSDFHPNPANPRTIEDKDFHLMVGSLKESPWMMRLRPIVVDENRMILAGLQRFNGLLHLKYTEVPDDWIVDADNLTPEQKNEFIVKDNAHYGTWDWRVAPDVWGTQPMEEWGIVPEWPDAETKPAVTHRRTTSTGEEEAFEVMLSTSDKKELKAILQRVKRKQGLSKLSEALMYIVTNHPKK